MTIREIPEFPICSDCKSGNFKTLPMKYPEEHEIIACKKCGLVNDYGLRKKEDYKHKIYHTAKGEPSDKSHISDNENPKTPPKPPEDDNVNIAKKTQTESVDTKQEEVLKISS